MEENFLGKHKYTKDSQLAHRCVEALYMSLLLEEGFGFDGKSRDITLALEVNGHEVEWTLGFALAGADFGVTPDSISNSSGSRVIDAGATQQHDSSDAPESSSSSAVVVETKTSHLLNMLDLLSNFPVIVAGKLQSMTNLLVAKVSTLITKVLSLFFTK